MIVQSLVGIQSRWREESRIEMGRLEPFDVSKNGTYKYPLGRPIIFLTPAVPRLRCCRVGRKTFRFTGLEDGDKTGVPSQKVPILVEILVVVVMKVHWCHPHSTPTKS